MGPRRLWWKRCAVTEPGGEERVLDWVAVHTRAAVPVARVITLLGETPVVWSAVTGTALGTAVRDRRWTAFALPVCTLAVAVGVRHALAEGIGRARPPRRLWRTHWSGPSCPSRHTTLATLGAALVADAVLPPDAARAVTRAVAVAVGASRLVLGVHWPTDVLAGWAFTAAALTTARQLRYGLRRDGLR